MIKRMATTIMVMKENMTNLYLVQFVDDNQTVQ